jgi:hypothetical protein
MLIAVGKQASGKKSKKAAAGLGNATAGADGQPPPDDLLQYLAERERWKKELAGREAEAKRMKRLAEKHMEHALRLKSRLAYERKRAAFFLERLDQATHQGSDQLELEWKADWKQRREAGATADDDDDDDDLDDDDDDDLDSGSDNSEIDGGKKHSGQHKSTKATANKKTKTKKKKKKKSKEEEPDELVEFFIRSPGQRRIPAAPSSLVPPLPALSASSVGPSPSNSPRPPMPSPPSRRPPPPPPGGASSATTTPSPPSSNPSSASFSPLPSPSTRPPPIRSPPYALAAPLAAEPAPPATAAPSPMSFGVVRYRYVMRAVRCVVCVSCVCVWCVWSCVVVCADLGWIGGDGEQSVRPDGSSAAGNVAAQCGGGREPWRRPDARGQALTSPPDGQKADPLPHAPTHQVRGACVRAVVRACEADL